MSTVALLSVSPIVGPTSGGDIVRVRGRGFAHRIDVRFGGVPGDVLNVRTAGGVSLADVRTPLRVPGLVDVEVSNLDDAGDPILGESAVLFDAYRFERPRLARESDLTRLIRTLLRELKVQVCANVSASVSVDYDDAPEDGLRLVAMATLPSIVVSGPVLRESRFYALSVPDEDIEETPSGVEIRRRKLPYTVDLAFTITVASERTAELFNLMAAMATFLNRNHWIAMARDPDVPTRGKVRWELEADGEFRTQLEGRDDVRAFTCGLVIRGFDIDEGLPLDVGATVVDPQLETERLP